MQNAGAADHWAAAGDNDGGTVQEILKKMRPNELLRGVVERCGTNETPKNNFELVLLVQHSIYRKLGCPKHKCQLGDTLLLQAPHAASGLLKGLCPFPILECLLRVAFAASQARERRHEPQH